jgi:uncharacterized protein with ParB-like and HNH nuclease domain
MSEPQLRLKPINDLLVLQEKFFVPSYQRGFRWTKRQVTELLDDIWEFRKKSEHGTKEEFYCLQPLVVAPKDNEWVLIDGQQRLTTIYLILLHLDPILSILGKNKYLIRYETRVDSESFLKNIDKSKKDQNIDYYHICEAYIAIEEWFSKKDGNAKINFLNTLLNDDETGKNVKVIWYEVGNDKDHIDIFTRINIGKIPLTNSELIKALFIGNLKSNRLSEDKVRLKQIQIAGEWDRIETTLQNNSFWYFIYEGNQNYETRIEYIFDLMKEKPDEEEDYFTFHKFNKDFDTDKNIKRIWSDVKKYFQTFEEWYNDGELYHLIGYLISTGYPILTLKTNSESKSKTQFKTFLADEISKTVNFNIDELRYEDRRVRPLLLLFNIKTILRNNKSNLRFPFDSYKDGSWDIEHIRSVKSDKPAGIKQRPWLEAVLEYFVGKVSPEKLNTAIDQLGEEKELANDIFETLQKDKLTDVDFSILYDKILYWFHEDTEPTTINDISNLTLLDSSTNRAYKNAVFPIKRKTIMENDMNGTFIPICTKNVFLKSYSKKFENLMFWQENDASDYLNAIKRVLFDYLSKNEIDE